MSNHPADSPSPQPEEAPRVQPDTEAASNDSTTDDAPAKNEPGAAPAASTPSTPGETAAADASGESAAPSESTAPQSLDESHAAESHAAESHAAESHAAESHAAESHAAESHAAESHAAESHAAAPVSAGDASAEPAGDGPPPSASAAPASSDEESAAESTASVPADGPTAGTSESVPDANAEPTASEASASTEAAGDPSGSPAAPSGVADGSAETTDESAKRDFKIGSRRGGKKSGPRGPRPQTPGSKPAPPSAPSGPVPVPSKRGPLPDDWEKEVEETLGGKSVDELLAGGGDQTGGAPAAVLEPESRVEAEVVRIHGDNVFLSLGGRNEGVASLRSFAADAQPEPGQTMEVVISSVSREDGLYEVVVPGAAVEVSDWADLVEGTVVEARITGTNTGGLECKVNNIRGFIPASQVALYRIEDFSEFVDTKMTCVVTEANERKRNLVLSHRAILERERAAEREKLLASLAVGQIHEGVVRNIRDFGAFVDLGGVDGMIHISQMSWERIKHPSEVVSQGDQVRVRIEKMDPDSNKIGLSLRSLQEHPWKDIGENFKVGSVVTGTVSRTANFGAFVKVAPGVEGLVHISELAHHRVSLVSSVVKEGDTVNVKVLSVDPEAQRMSLSIKQTIEQPQPDKGKAKNEEVEEDRQPTLPKHKGPLKGGVDGPSGGEQFGLKW